MAKNHSNETTIFPWWWIVRQKSRFLKQKYVWDHGPTKTNISCLLELLWSQWKNAQLMNLVVQRNSVQRWQSRCPSFHTEKQSIVVTFSNMTPFSTEPMLMGERGKYQLPQERYPPCFTRTRISRLPKSHLTCRWHWPLQHQQGSADAWSTSSQRRKLSSTWKRWKVRPKPVFVMIIIRQTLLKNFSPT